MILFQPKHDIKYIKQFMRHSYDIRTLNEKKFMFLLNNRESEQNLESFVGLTQYAEPITLLLSFDSEGFNKYIFNDKVQNAIQFYYDWKQGKLQKFVKSEPIPDYETNKDPIKSLVHFNFNEYMEMDKDILLFMYEKRQYKHQAVLDVLYNVLFI